MKHLPNRRLRAGGPWGFTLTELLVVISIITIIATFALLALNTARHHARVTKTKSLVGKLDEIIRNKLEEYQYRRVPISTAGLAPQAAAEARLFGLRDIMRMELPERWADVTAGPGTIPYLNTTITRPALSRAYLRRYQQSTPSGEYGSAECLYMIVTMGTEDGRSKFADHDIGDADGDGYPEFHDAWGNPIKFLRWPPGFLPAFQGDSDEQTGNYAEDHDPLDSMEVQQEAYKLVPLIYSAGPDGIYDINVEGGSYFYGGNMNPYAQNVGQPIDSDNMSVTAPGSANNRLDHYDNIHNHRREAE